MNDQVHPELYQTIGTHNGDQAIFDGHMSPQIMTQAAALGVTIYKRAIINDESVWTADGRTPAPDYIDTIGCIA